MTTIAYRNGVMAGDRQTTAGDIRTGGKTKVFRRSDDGALIGLAGSSSIAAGYLRWFLAGEAGDRPPLAVDESSAVALVVRPNWAIEHYDQNGYFGWETPFAAVGSGYAVALGAMAAGADARRAVEIAAEFDIYTGAGVDVVRLRAPVSQRRRAAKGR